MWSLLIKLWAIIGFLYIFFSLHSHHGLYLFIHNIHLVWRRKKHAYGLTRTFTHWLFTREIASVGKSSPIIWLFVRMCAHSVCFFFFFNKLLLIISIEIATHSLIFETIQHIIVYLSTLNRLVNQRVSFELRHKLWLPCSAMAGFEYGIQFVVEYWAYWIKVEAHQIPVAFYSN